MNATSMAIQKLIFPFVFAFLFLFTVSAVALGAGDVSGGSGRQDNRLHLEAATGYQYFNPHALYEGLLPYGDVKGSGVTLGGGAAYNLSEFTLGLRFDLARTFPGSDGKAYQHWSVGPEIGWMRHFEPLTLQLAVGYAYHRMDHYYRLGGEYGGGDLTTKGHAVRLSTTVRRSLDLNWYVGVRPQFEAVAFHRNNSGTFLCSADYSCDPEQSKGITAGIALLVGRSF